MTQINSILYPAEDSITYACRRVGTRREIVKIEKGGNVEIRKWMIVLLITAVAGKFFAAGLTRLKIFPQDKIAALEKIAEQKISHLFSSDKQQPPVEQKPFYKWPIKKSQVAVRTPPIPVRSPAPTSGFNPVVPKKSRADLAKEEKERRKKRKKKLEQAADKNKKKNEFTLISLAHEEKTITQSAPVDSGLVYPLPLPPQPGPTVTPTPLTAAPSFDLNLWITLLTTQPTTTNLNSFEAIYKSGQISAQQYYSVMSKLFKSSNSDARKIAILGSSFETNPLAFQLLTHEKYSESVVALQNSATQAIQTQYAKVAALSFLAQPLMSNDLFSRIEAATLVGQIAQNIKISSTALTADVKLMFNRYVPIFTAMSKDGSSRPLQEAATNALGIIRSLLT